MHRAESSSDEKPVSDSDITRYAVIAGLTASITVLVVLDLPRNPGSIVPQLFLLPILYAAYCYPRPGIYVAGFCGVVYEIVGSVAVYPDPVAAAFVIGQGALFVITGCVVAHLSEKSVRACEENRRLDDQIRRDNEQRRGVIVTVAHELRTPLQPLMGYLNLLLEDPADYGINADTQKILNRCLASVERERTIINRMLEFSVLESGKVRLEYSVFPVRESIDTIINAGGYASQAAITVDIPEDLTFDADATKIGIAFDSLLSNAIAYSRPPRNIKISYISFPGSGCHGIAVCDNGIGIPEGRLDTIFEPFQLADSAALSRKYDRIGLSLAIAQKYLRMHGGFITVESIVNQGSTFTLHIPKLRDTGDCP